MKSTTIIGLKRIIQRSNNRELCCFYSTSSSTLNKRKDNKRTEYIGRLTKELNVSVDNATHFYDGLSKIIEEALFPREIEPLKWDQYNSLIQSLHKEIQDAHAQIQADEQAQLAAMQADFEAISREANAVKAAIQEEAAQIAASVHLDIDFGKQRLKEADDRIEEQDATMDEAERVRLEALYADLNAGFFSLIAGMGKDVVLKNGLKVINLLKAPLKSLANK